jgi:hypothetical protein
MARQPGNHDGRHPSHDGLVCFKQAFRQLGRWQGPGENTVMSRLDELDERRAAFEKRSEDGGLIRHAVIKDTQSICTTSSCNAEVENRPFGFWGAG